MGVKMTRARPSLFWRGGLLLAAMPAVMCLLAGCSTRPRLAAAHGTPASTPAAAGDDVLAPGVVHRAIPLGDGGVDLIDVDLVRSRARLTLQTSGIRLSGGSVVGRADTPRAWMEKTGGLAAVNGGYFGGEDAQGRKEFVGLLVQKGRVRHAAPPLMGQGSATIRRGRYVRSAFGLIRNGTPQITWAATRPGHFQNITAYAAPMGQSVGAWEVRDAVGCGPTLIFQGRVVVTQYGERLVSPGPRARTFVAYDAPGGRPAHLVFGIASGADFYALAAFLIGYFPRSDGSRAGAAMCLDGGASTQMTYRLGGTVRSPRETGVTVPDALVLLPR